MKKILIGVIVILVVIGGAGVYVFLNAGGIIKQIVEKVGSQATKTKVSLSKVDLSIQSGEAALTGFQISSPSGFKSPKAMSFGIVSFKIDPASVTSDVILVKEIVIAKPEITYESASGGGSNFDAIQKNVDSYAKEMGVSGGGGAKKIRPKPGVARKSLSNICMCAMARLASVPTSCRGRQLARICQPSI